LATDGAGGFRTARWNLPLPAAQSQALDLRGTQLQLDDIFIE